MRKYAIILLSLVLALLPIVSCKKSVVVTGAVMEDYAQTYLTDYSNLLQEHIHPNYWEYFAFYENYHVIATISTVHGAALEFKSSEYELFEVRTVNEKIEQAIFKDKDLNIYDVGPVDYTLFIFTGSAGTLIISVEGTLSVRNIVFITNKGYFLDVSETGIVLTEGIIVDNIVYYHPILIKGSNRENNWTKEIATEDALRYFVADIPDAFLGDAFVVSEEFRKLIAYPELERIAKRLIEKRDKGEYGKENGYLEFERDFNELYETAKRYGLSSEFAENIYNFLKEEKEEQGKPSFWERYLYPILASVFGSALLTLLIRALAKKRYAKGKDKEKKSSTQKARRKRKRKLKMNNKRG